MWCLNAFIIIELWPRSLLWHNAIKESKNVKIIIMNNINDKQLFVKNSQQKSQEIINELNEKFKKRKLNPSEMLARFQWYRQNGLPTKINSLIEKFALEETGKNRGRIPQLILESDFPKLREEINKTIDARKKLERLEKIRPRYSSTNYTDFDDYYESIKRLWESQIESEKELLNLNETQWEQIHKNFEKQSKKKAEKIPNQCELKNI